MNRTVENLSTFKWLPKTHLFNKCYQTSGCGEVVPSAWSNHGMRLYISLTNNKFWFLILLFSGGFTLETVHTLTTLPF
jgi:hypothetical protein